ncbi:prepilin peptidase [Oricola cellulosilytica]|uniref:Prepilin peptidase n=1 Tax=Oricola cellulosilytica TaxID=1429082 RepID=A0A4R0PI51_9HYPH|nr:A24 family peptidase [Oricola cellulosilytica]TCD16668.1 prepilin peptidase [Oricola cellulosilytica]
MVLLGILAVIVVVDLRELRIPDLANLALLAGGLVFWWIRDVHSVPLQLAAAAGGFTLFWIVRALHLRLSSRVGLGLGDVKMAGASAAWFHPSLFPVFLLVSSATALCAILILASARRKTIRSYRLPFGPFLAIGLFITWMIEVAFV